MVTKNYLTYGAEQGCCASDCLWLLCFVTGCSKTELLLRKEALSQQENALYQALVKRRRDGEPLQYLLGEWEFCSLPFLVSPAVLIPRPETELLAELAIQNAASSVKAIDLCTGSGALAVTLSHRTGLAVTAVDISEDALSVARENAERNSAKVTFLQMDLLKEYPKEQYDLVISNPPYIRTEEIDRLMPEVQHEPRIALDGGKDGLIFYRRIASLPIYTPDALLLLEIGWDQGEDVSALLKENGFCEIKVIKDLAGQDRIVTGRKQP